jgi:hypothetical protein
LPPTAGTSFIPVPINGFIYTGIIRVFGDTSYPRPADTRLTAIIPKTDLAHSNEFSGDFNLSENPEKKDVRILTRQKITHHELNS